MIGRRTRAIAIVLSLLVASAGAAAWLWMREPRQPPLDPGWTAIAQVLAGDGIAGGRDGHSSRARFSDPFGIARGSDGTIFVADAGTSQRIRRIAPDGTVSTVAGGVEGFADGASGDARFNGPSGLAVAADGTIYVADTANHAIRRIRPDGYVSTLAGGHGFGHRDGSGADALFNGPIGVALDSTGRVIVADAYNDRIRAITADGIVVTLAGSGQRGSVDGGAAEAQFDTPSGVAVDEHGSVYVADTGNNLVRIVSPDGTVSTVGPPPPYGLVRPIGIAVDDGGVVFVTDDRGRVVEMAPGVRARTLVGSRPGFAEGAGDQARFRGPSGLAITAPGRLVVADSRNALLRVVRAPSRMGLTIPASPRINPQFDPEAFALDGLLWPLSPMEGPYEITGTLGEARGGPGSERFHAGLDVHASEGTPVVAVRDGIVSGPLTASDFGTLNESVRIGNVAYVHLRVGRLAPDEIIDDPRFVANYDETGKLAGIRVKRGAQFSAGDVIGTVNRFNHVHMNVGWPGEEYNPLRFPLVQFQDTTPPSIRRGGIRLFDEAGNAIAAKRKGRVLVTGRVHVVVDAWDQVDGNERRRRLGVYQLGYQMLKRDGSPVRGFEAPLRTIRFDRLVADDEAARMVYWSGSGIPFFVGGSTHFLYAVTNTFRGGSASPGLWDTSLFEPGDYILRVIASDISGNEATTNRDVAVTIVPAIPAGQ
jgi:sugar lactone lactonase YvrE